jgi:cell wall-associated NlpC family hydrolase
VGIQLPTYPMAPAPAWCAPYIGLPYENGARGPAAWDCWGILWKVLAEQFDIEIPRYEGIHWERNDPASRIEAAHHYRAETEQNWLPVQPGEERAGDALALNIAGRPLHVGIVATAGWMLHSAEDADCSLERYDGLLWRRRVEGIYRHRELAA